MPELKLAPYQAAALFNPFTHFAMYGSVGSGKSYAGSAFVAMMHQRYPGTPGFIGANDYNQLSTVSLKHVFARLDELGIEYVADCLPPKHWNEPKKFKTYQNILSMRDRATRKVTYVYTRTLSEADRLRGIEFGWYWIDETRDTEQEAHDEIMKRMRNQPVYKGLITTTTNGRKWDWERFVKNAGKHGNLFGSMHVPISEAIRWGICTEEYANTMRAALSPLMALQELEALHVNASGGMAYHSASDKNRRQVSPWGDAYPDPSRNLIVGCDFNFDPSPCVWIVGQTGPGQWADRIHWFGEISDYKISSTMMARKLMSQYPGFFYEIYGDSSGNMGTTSNAGEFDYAQIGQELDQGGAPFSISADQSNPSVRDRVENMNGLLLNALGQRRMTYNPVTCPFFDGDMTGVGWKENTGSMRGRGKLESGGDVNRTHSSDAAGYAVWKKFPPGRRGNVGFGIMTGVREETGLTSVRHRAW